MKFTVSGKRKKFLGVLIAVTLIISTAQPPFLLDADASSSDDVYIEEQNSQSEGSLEKQSTLIEPEDSNKLEVPITRDEPEGLSEEMALTEPVGLNELEDSTEPEGSSELEDSTEPEGSSELEDSTELEGSDESTDPVEPVEEPTPIPEEVQPLQDITAYGSIYPDVVANSNALRTAIASAGTDITITVSGFALDNNITIPTNKSITLVGETSSVVLTSASNKRHLTLTDSTSSLTLRNITLDGNNVSGGVNAGAGTFTLEADGVIKNCKATNADVKGGALESMGTVNIYGMITGSWAKYGGGIYAENATITMTSGVIGANEAYQGGGIYSKNSPIKISGGTIGATDLNQKDIQGNKASTYTYNYSIIEAGAGIYATGANATIELFGTGAINGNEAYRLYLGWNETGYGGGIYAIDAGRITVSGSSTISGNYATDGAGIYAVRTPITVDGGTIGTTNFANKDSEGYNLEGNLAFSLGGGIYSIDAPDVSNAILIKSGKISGNSTQKTIGPIANGSTTMSTNDGGGIYVTRTDAATSTNFVSIEGGEIGYNFAYVNGGGIYANNAPITISGGQIIGNKAPTDDFGYYDQYMDGGHGGGIYAIASPIIISNGDIKGNEAFRNGGGIFSNSSDIELTGGNIGSIESSDLDTPSLKEAAGNKAGRYGGGIYIINANLSIPTGGSKVGIGCNSATDGYGGGIAAVHEGNDHSIKINNNEAYIQGNVAKHNGGGIYVEQVDVELLAGKILDNKARTGGGIIVYEALLTISNGSNSVEISRNTADGGSGGGVYIGSNLQQNALNMSGGIISYNTATLDGGGICASGAPVTVNGGTIDYNEAARGGGIYVYQNGSITTTPLTLSNSSSVSHNTASVSGGGIYFLKQGKTSGADIVLGNDGTTQNISYNEANGTAAGQGGGGIYITDDSSALNNPQLVINKANIEHNESGNNGGGIYMNLVKTYANATDIRKSTITNGNINYNKASNNGGGLYVDRTTEDTAQVPSGFILVDGVTINNNEATSGSGGGVYFTKKYAANVLNFQLVPAPNDYIIISGATIKSNSAAIDGGGIFVQRLPMTVTNTTVSANKAISGNGGGINADTAVLTINGSTIGTITEAYGNPEGNTAKNGGGIYFLVGKKSDSDGTNWYAYENLIINGGTSVSGNTASESGGGIYVSKSWKSSSLTKGVDLKLGDGIEEVDVRYNTSKGVGAEQGGGGIYLGEDDLSAYFDTVILNTNKANIEHNVSESNGGGIYMKHTMIKSFIERTKITDSYINYNSAKTNGGGIAVDCLNGSFSFLDIIGGQVSGNIASGTASDQGGGGIYINSCLLFVDKATIGTTSTTQAVRDKDGNKAVNGGGIYITGNNRDSEQLFILYGDGEVSGNSATNNGGGIYLDDFGSTNSTITLSIGGFNYNAQRDEYGHINANTAKHGGGIYAVNSQNPNQWRQIEVYGTINNNEATVKGGGAYLESVYFSLLEKSSMVGNKADLTSGKGGGVYADRASVSFTGSIVGADDFRNRDRDGNKAAFGGGVYLDTSNDHTKKGRIYLAGSGWTTTGRITGNIATKDGGGIYVTSPTQIPTTKTTSTFDYIVRVGGDGRIEHNVAEGDGGGVWMNNVNLVAAGGSINGNEAKSGNGGGVYSQNSSILSSDIGPFNKAVNGGGVYVKGNNLFVDISSITQNIATKNGGGIYLDNLESFELIKQEIVKNTANSGNGGGIYADNTPLTITGGKINENSSKNGGGIYAEGLLTTITIGNSGFGSGTTYSSIAENQATENGGGIYANASGDVTFSGGTIGKNTAKNGGGVYLNNTPIKVIDGIIGASAYKSQVITGNIATNGGGVYSNGASSAVTMSGGEINGNTAANGGGIYNNTAQIDITAGKISNNKANGNGTDTGFGGGIYVDPTLGGIANLTVELGVIFSGNTATGDPQKIRINDDQYFTGYADGTAIIALHTTNIFATTFSSPMVDGYKLYNNYDVNYKSTAPETPTILKAPNLDFNTLEITAVSKKIAPAYSAKLIVGYENDVASKAIPFKVNVTATEFKFGESILSKTKLMAKDGDGYVDVNEIKIMDETLAISTASSEKDLSVENKLFLNWDPDDISNIKLDNIYRSTITWTISFTP